MDTIDIITMKNIILLGLWLDYIWEQYLCFKQYQKVSATTEVPTVLEDTTSKKTFELSKQYMKEKKLFGFIKDHINILISTTVIHFDILPKIWNYSRGLNGCEILTDCLWFLIFTTLIATINLPLTIYELFVIEANYKLKKPDPPYNKLKSFFLNQILLTVLGSILIGLVQSGDRIFVGTFAVLGLLVLVVGLVYPIMPPCKLRSQIPLRKGELRKEIQKLCLQLHFPLRNIYVEEHSRCATPYCIYFYGTTPKTIVLSDALFQEDEEFTTDEITALVTQEMGRWYHNHSVLYVLTLVLNIFLAFAGFLYFFKHPKLYEVFGFQEHRPVLVGIYVVIKYVMVVFSTLLSFFFTYVSRRFVFVDDLFATRLGKGEALIGGLVKLEQNVMCFPVFDRMYSAWHNDKPTLLERVAQIKLAVDEKGK